MHGACLIACSESLHRGADARFRFQQRLYGLLEHRISDHSFGEHETIRFALHVEEACDAKMKAWKPRGILAALQLDEPSSPEA